jgi:uncharacterized DUF497 family protein
MEFDFEWDPAKGLLNTKNHGVTFEEAASVLLDPLALSVLDQAHSIDEERWFTIGQNSSGILMVVVHTFETRTATRVRVRVISARKPTTNERPTYEAEPR